MKGIDQHGYLEDINIYNTSNMNTDDKYDEMMYIQ